MKKIMLSALLLAFATTATIAQPVNTEMIKSTLQQEKSPVKLEELPDKVKETLAGEAYAGWTQSEAFVITKEDGSKQYEVILKTDEDAKTVNIAEDGKVIEVPIIEVPSPEEVPAPEVQQ